MSITAYGRSLLEAQFSQLLSTEVTGDELPEWARLAGIRGMIYEADGMISGQMEDGHDFRGGAFHPDGSFTATIV